MTTYPSYVAVVLAGGAARRMDGQAKHGLKTLLPLAGKPILEHICTNLQQAVPPPEDIALNIVAEQRQFAPDMPLALDMATERQGPLAGISAGLNWCAQYHPKVDWMLSVSGDTPFLPSDLVIKLFDRAHAQKTLIAYAASKQRYHPTIALWSCSLREALEEALMQGMRKVDHFSCQYRPAIVEWPCDGLDPFLNINQPEDIIRAEQIFSLEFVCDV